MPKYLILSPTVYEAKPLFNKFGIGGTPKTGACAESQNGEITVLATGIGCAASSTRVREAVKNCRRKLWYWRDIAERAEKT